MTMHRIYGVLLILASLIASTIQSPQGSVLVPPEYHNERKSYPSHIHARPDWNFHDDTSGKLFEKQLGGIKNSATPICKAPPKNITLKLSNMSLKRIDDDFVRCTDVTAVYLNNNEIVEVSSSAFRMAPNLVMLDLSRNKIAIDKLLKHRNLENLQTLILDENEGSAGKNRIPKTTTTDLPNLKYLHLRKNRILHFNIILKDATPTLTHLYLSKNNISSAQFLENLPVSLTHLCVDDNLLTKVTKGIPKSLVHLSMNGNKIKQLCRQDCDGSALSLEGAGRLRELHLARNNILEIAEDTFQDLTSLIDLDLSYNEINCIQNDTFYGSRMIESINLRGNKLVKVPNLCRLDYLKTLDLSHNKISNVADSSLCQAASLKTLLLNNNGIVNIESNAFSNRDSLEFLDLSSNSIIDLPANWIHPARSLQILLLRNNSVVNIEKLSLDGFISLVDLHLEENPLPHLKIQDIMHYPPTLLVHLNPPRKALGGRIDNDRDEDYYDYKDDKDDEEEDNVITSESSWGFLGS